MHLGYLVEVGTRDEIFNNPVHPYTKSLLSAIPNPDPIYEKSREILIYDSSDVDYSKGVRHQLSETHSVLATPEELACWIED